MDRLRLAGRVSGLRPTAINQVLHEAREWELGQGRRLQEGTEPADLVYRLRRQPDTATPAGIVQAAERSLRAGRTGYADNRGEPKLREAVATKLARDNGLTYDPGREILITDGATCGISTALAVLIGPGDDVLLPDPIYD